MVKSPLCLLVTAAGSPPLRDLDNSFSSAQFNRRQFATCLVGATLSLPPASAVGTTTVPRKLLETTEPQLIRVRDPSTYEALVYSPPSISYNGDKQLPLLLVLHGAGRNDQSAWSLADTNGEHAGLAPSLLASQQAPESLRNNFYVVAPYVGEGKRSFYEEPRSTLLQFLDWFLSEQGQAAGCPRNVDNSRICLFGFSDGATVAVELATTQRFRCVVVASYGFTGSLPELALQRLEFIPMWVFHSLDDVIFPVRCSDNLVSSLRGIDSTALLQSGELGATSRPNAKDKIRYTRYIQDPEGCTGSIRGHCVGITASKNPEVYSWMLSA